MHKEPKFIVGEKPPNWEILEKKFKVKWENVVVTYGDCVYSAKQIPPDLVVHESVHVRQQGDNPKEWWDKYLKDKEFRLNQELEAYKEQTIYIRKKVKDRNLQYRCIHKLASDLSGEMYGKCISFHEAYKILIKT